MQFASYITRPKRLRLPGRAGALLEAGSIGPLVKELGGNYATYHRHLAQVVAEVGRPRLEDFDDRETFLEAWTLAQEAVLMEAFLRNCRSNLLHGRALDLPLDDSVPLVDADDRLVSVE